MNTANETVGNGRRTPYCGRFEERTFPLAEPGAGVHTADGGRPERSRARPARG